MISLPCIVPVLFLLLWSVAASGSSSRSSVDSHVPNAHGSSAVSDSQCPSEEPGISISLLQTRRPMLGSKMDAQDHPEKDDGSVGKWHKIPLSKYSWRYVPGHEDVWGEFQIFPEPPTKTTTTSTKSSATTTTMTTSSPEIRTEPGFGALDIGGATTAADSGSEIQAQNDQERVMNEVEQTM